MKIPVLVPSVGDDTAYVLRKKILDFQKRYELNLYTKLPRPAHMAEDMARRAELQKMKEELAEREEKGPDGEAEGILIAFVPTGDNISAIVQLGSRFLKFDLEEVRPATGTKSIPLVMPVEDHPTHLREEVVTAKEIEEALSHEEPEPEELPNRSGLLPPMPGS